MRRLRAMTLALLCCAAGSTSATVPAQQTVAPAASYAATTPAPVRPPNIVLVMLDDLGYGDIGANGSTTIRTPNVDALAKAGTRFTTFYAGAPNCSPSRAALMTGRYPIRYGVQGVFFPDSFTGVPAREETMAEMLRRAGYATLAVGKWHLGHHAEFLPTNQGFDRFFGTPYSNDMRNYVLMRDAKVVEQAPDQAMLTQRFTDEVTGFIKAKRAQPFFAYVAYPMPHVPLYPSKPFRGKSKGGLYGDVVEEIDANVGRIMDALRAAGVERNTLVIFTSDNGPWLEMGTQGGSAGPFRSGKHTTFEGGVRVPFVAYWPGHVPAGGTEARMVSALDLLPTFAALAGVKPVPAGPLDGDDERAVLEGRAGPERPARYAYYLYGQLGGLRVGDWKILLPWGGRLPDLLKYKWPGSEPAHGTLLYNLKSDPSETTDLARQRPEIVAMMEREVAALKAGFGTLPPAVEKEIVQDHSHMAQRDREIAERARSLGLEPPGK